MATPNRGFGHPRAITGKGGNTHLATMVPLAEKLYSGPIPATISGANNVTFTLKGVTRPIPIWNGNDFVCLDEDFAYTWNNTSNAILDSDGAADTDADSVLGVWYMYISINDDSTGSLVMKPSQTGPVTFASGAFDAGVLGHPGTSRTQFWTYVGFMICTTAATPAFSAALKIGYWWTITEQSAVIPTASWAAPTNLTLYIPKLGFAGAEVGGAVETAAGVGIWLGAHTASTLYSVEARVAEVTASNVALQTAYMPFRMSPNDTTSPIYGIAGAGGAGDVRITTVKDVV